MFQLKMFAGGKGRRTAPPQRRKNVRSTSLIRIGLLGVLLTFGSSRAFADYYMFRTLAGSAWIPGNADGAGREARFRVPRGVAVDSAGAAYIADTANLTLRKIDPDGTVSTLAGLAGASGQADGAGSAARFRYPVGVAVDNAGVMYIADSWNHTIRKVTPGGTVSTLAGLAGFQGSADGAAGNARFKNPTGVAVDSTGTVYVADSNNNTIRKITPLGEVSTLAGLAGKSGGTDGTGNAARFDGPASVAVDSAGNVYVAEVRNNTIRKITPAGEVTTLAGMAQKSGSTDGTGSTARFYHPHGLAADSAGNLFVADIINQTIRSISPEGVVTTVAGLAQRNGSVDGAGSTARFDSPVGLAVGSAGDIYVTDSSSHTIRRGVFTTGSAPPTITVISAVTFLEDRSANIDVFVSDQDSDPGDILTTVSSSNTDLVNEAGLVIAGSGANRSLTITPLPDANGTGTISVTADDQGGGLTTQSFLVIITAVNDAPRFTKGADLVVLEDAGKQTMPLWTTELSPGAADESAQKLTFLVNNDNRLLFSVQPVISPDGTLTCTPAPNANGVATVTVKLQDTGGIANGGVHMSAEQTFTITVNPVNDAPSFFRGANVAALENSGFKSIPNWASNIKAGPADESGQTLVSLTSSDNPALFSVPPAISPDGTLTFTVAEPDISGFATVTAQLQDDGGTADGGIDTSIAQTFTITVIAVNHAPSFTKGADQIVLEDAGKQTAAQWAGDLSPGSANESTQRLTFVVSNDNRLLFSVQPVISPDGTLTYTPALNANGVATVTVKIQDTGGIANGGENTSAEQTFTITVNPVNDAPSFSKGANVTVLEDSGAKSIPTWAGNIKAGPADESGQGFTFLVSNDKPSLFSVPPEISADGTLTFTVASPDLNGTATVTVKLQDDGGTDTSAAQTFTITVTPVNDPPSFSLATTNIEFITAVLKTIPNFVTDINRGAPDESAQSVSFVLSSDKPSFFSVQPVVSPTGTLTFTPAATASGSVTVTVTAFDSGGTAFGGSNSSAPQTFTISKPGAAAPVLAALPNLQLAINSMIHPGAADLKTFVTDADSSSATMQFRIANLAQINAAFGLSDGQNGGVSGIPVVTIGMDPDSGTFKVRPSGGIQDNTIHVHPRKDFTGSTTVTIEAKDAEGNVSNQRTFSVVINPTNAVGWIVKTYKNIAVPSVTSLSAADALISGGYVIASGTMLQSDMVGFNSGHGTGHFEVNNAVPGISDLQATDDYAVQSIAQLAVTSPGNYTFGMNTDDGARLRIDGETVIVDNAVHPPQDSDYATISLTAGLHSVEWTWFNSRGGGLGGGAVAEVFAAPGSKSGFDADFRLLGEDPLLPLSQSNPTANQGPTIVTQPQNQAVLAGSTARISVMATGTPPLTYRWRLNGSTLTDNDRINGANATSLTISDIQSSDAGIYTVVVGNDDGSLTSAGATLTLADSVPASSVYTFTTIAGLVGNSGSADGTANAARFNYPAGVAADSALNIYVADSNNHTIRKIIPSGSVTTFAGAPGTAGSADGASSAARFNSPNSVAVDGSGNLYVADTQNHCIRKISPLGNVTTFAGLAGNPGSADGIGSGARFYGPISVAVDSAGNVFVADIENRTIRSITPSGVVTTLAGLAGNVGSADGTGSTARFNDPRGVAVDNIGNVYVADTGNVTIRKIAPGGVVTTLAGLAGTAGSADGPGSAARFTNPYSVAVDMNRNVFVADNNNCTIRKITQTGLVTTIGGSALDSGSADGIGSAARFSFPFGVAIDAAGNVYVADTYNHTIRKGVPVAEESNTPPVISSISSQTTIAATPIGPLSFTVSDAETPAANLAVTGTSSDPVLVPNANIEFAGSGTTRTVTVTPDLDRTGTTQIAITVSDGSLNSTTTFTLTVNPAPLAPSISASPQSQSVAVGANVTFAVVATGTAPLSYQWRKGGVNISGATSSTLDLGNVSAGQAGDYSVVVSNEAGSLTSPNATLTVNEPVNTAPTISSIVDQTAITGALVGALVFTVGDAQTPATGLVVTGTSANQALVPNASIVIGGVGANRTVTLTPVRGQVGTVEITLTASDGSLSGTTQFVLTVEPFPPPGSGTGLRGEYFNGTNLTTLRRVRIDPEINFVWTGTTPDPELGYPYSVRWRGQIEPHFSETYTFTTVSDDGVRLTINNQTIIDHFTIHAPATDTGTIALAGGQKVDVVLDYFEDTVGGGAIISLSWSSRSQPSGIVPQSQLYPEPIVNTAPSASSIDDVAILEGDTPPSAEFTILDLETSAIDLVVTATSANQTLVPDANFAIGGSGTSRSVTVTPNANTIGIAEIALEVSDGSLSSSTRFVLTVNALPPVITVQPQSQASVDGTEVTLSVTATGRPPLSYQWQKDGVDIVDATGATLAFTSVTVSQEGHYTVIVSNAGGTLASSPPALLTVDPAYTWSTIAGVAESGGRVDGTGNVARFNHPRSAAVDGAGNLYIVDSGNSTIRKITSTGVVTTFAGMAASSGKADGTGSAARFNHPPSVAADSQGNLYVADPGNHTIRKITPSGVVSTLAGLAGSSGSANGTGSTARFSNPSGVAVDGASNVYVGDSGNNTIRKITPGGVVSTLAGLAGTSGLTDGTGNAARFTDPKGVAVDGSGNVYVADASNHTIRKVTPNGVVTTLAGSAGINGSADGTGSEARFNFPTGVAVDLAGNVYVTDLDNNTIRKIRPGGIVTTLGGLPETIGSADGTAAEARFYNPFGLVVDTAGSLYVADTSNNTIRKGAPFVGGLPNTPAEVLISNRSIAHNTVSFAENFQPQPTDSANAPILQASRLNGIFQLSITTSPGRTYTLEYTDSVPSLDWSPITAVGGDGRPKVLVDSNASDSQRFYRVRVEP